VEQCEERAREAIELHIEGLIADGLPVPEEQTPPQVLTVQVA
jgi:predicted RNase H-like HicB family nuclease